MANDIQSGSIVRKSHKYYVRYRKDDRTKPYVFISPADPKAPDYLDKHQREKRKVEILDSLGVNGKVISEETKMGITFSVAAGSWLNELETRDYRKPISPATAKGYKSYLTKLNALCGDVPLASFTAAKLGSVVQNLKNEGLSSKSIREIAAVAKQVVASITNDDGEPLFDRKWPEKVCRIPLQGKQKQPCFQAPEVEKIVELAEAQATRYGALCALLAGTGLRFSEALAIELGPEHPDSSTISKDCRVIHVRRSVFGVVKADVKTKSAIRDVDVAPELADYLKSYIGNRNSGYLFESASHKPLSQRNVLRDCLHPILRDHTVLTKAGMKPNGVNEDGTKKYKWTFTETKIAGVVANAKDKRLAAHGFRRYRLTQLRSLTPPVPPDLIRFWMGHADKEIGDVYCKLKERIEFRRKIAAEVGLGFKLPATGTKVVTMPKEKIG